MRTIIISQMGSLTTLNTLPDYFYLFVSATGFDVHTHNTRHRHNIRALEIKHEFRNKWLRFSIVNTFNLSPDKIYTHCFCHYVKKYYLATYDSTCNIQNCFLHAKKLIPIFITFTHLFHISKYLIKSYLYLWYFTFHSFSFILYSHIKYFYI